MLLGCCELDQISPLPEGGHAPGYLLLCLGNRLLDGFLKLSQYRLHRFRLLPDLFLNGLGRFSAVMVLIDVTEVPSAFWTSPHHITLAFFVRSLTIVGKPLALRHCHIGEGCLEGRILRAASINAEAVFPPPCHI